jgi:hypothetical protein
MIDIGAEIDSGLGRKYTGINIGEALDPRVRSELGGANSVGRKDDTTA